MSSRVLRKLQGDPDIAVPGAEEEERQDDFLRHGARPKKINLNPFELLDKDSESEVKEDDDLGTEASIQSNLPQQERENILKRQDTKKKKKKKTRKKGGKANSHFISSEDNPDETDNAGLDEIDRSVQEVNKILGKDQTASVQSKASHEHHAKDQHSKSPHAILRNLLSIEYRNLNPENEMKKIFGSKVVQAELKQQQMQRHHHLSHHHRGGGRARAHLRSTRSIIVPKANWPNPSKSGGLSMKFIDSDSKGNQFFTFEHSQQYQSVQEQFYVAVESMNPDLIVALLNHYPFHIDAMLQLSDICKMGEDVQMATELIERALFTMESAFHPLFNLASGTCKLDYRRQENRAFFIALFRHLNFIGSRACYRTALEFSKLLLNLDPDNDPVGALLLLDFYALRSEQYQWFVSFYESMEPTKNLSQLPNWAYSVAVAYFYVTEQSSPSSTSKDFSKADERLQYALMMFPGVLLPLLDKCSIEPDRIGIHDFFVSAQLGQKSGLEILTKLYIGRSFHIWKHPELLPWLERNVKEVTKKVDAGDSLIKSYADKRKTRYQGTPRNIYRHVIMSDIKDAMTSLPRELAAMPVMSYDPLPPTDSIDKYSEKSRSAQANDSNPLSLFFRSFLPNFNPDDAGDRDNERGAEGRPGDLRSSVNSLYEAMQELLGNLHLPEIPHDAADSEDSDDEQDPNWQ